MEVTSGFLVGTNGKALEPEGSEGPEDGAPCWRMS